MHNMMKRQRIYWGCCAATPSLGTATTIDEFKGMNPKDVVQYIEGEPYISTVPVDAGSTNVEKEKDGEKVIGLNTENSELHE